MLLRVLARDRRIAGVKINATMARATSEKTINKFGNVHFGVTGFGLA